MVVGGHAVRADPVRCQFTSDDGKKFDRFQTGVYAKSDLSAGKREGKVMLLCFRATQYQSLALAFAKATGSFSPQSAR